MYLNGCKFLFSKDPRQFYNFVNVKRKSSELRSSVRFNSIKGSTESEIAKLLIVQLLGQVLTTLITLIEQIAFFPSNNRKLFLMRFIYYNINLFSWAKWTPRVCP